MSKGVGEYVAHADYRISPPSNTRYNHFPYPLHPILTKYCCAADNCAMMACKCAHRYHFGSTFLISLEPGYTVETKLASGRLSQLRRVYLESHNADEEVWVFAEQLFREMPHLELCLFANSTSSWHYDVSCWRREGGH